MLRGRGGSEQGSVAVTVALVMTVLLGIAALVVDIGLNWATRTSAQTAADAAALAGAATLLSDGPLAAISEVETFLDQNVDGLAGVAGWATDGVEANGEIVCWTLPDDPPAPGAACPDGSNAIQVITPPIEVQYAFAPVLGKSSNSIKALAAAGAGPAAPNNCVLCVLDLDGASRLAALGPGGVDVTGGGIVVNSDDPAALVTAFGDISAEQIRVVGGFNILPGSGDFFPLPEVGGPPVADPLAGLPTPDELPSPPIASPTPVLDVTTSRSLDPGIYASVTVSGTAVLTLEPGTYVFTDQGLTVEDDASVVSSGDGVTIYLACGGYPAPCSGSGARFRLEDDGRFQASPPSSGDYAGLSIFADRGNTRSMRLRSNRDLTLGGALYGPSTPLRIQDSGDLTVDSLLVVNSLTMPLGSSGSAEVNYDPSVPLPGLARPVLIR